VNHLSSLQLCVFIDDALVGAPDNQAARHLAECAMCRARYEAWGHVDDSLRELLGQVPEEYAMEQRTTWVEIAVAAERKGLPAPEFAELRIPLDTPAHPAPQVFPAAAYPPPAGPQTPPPASSIPGFIPSPGLAHLFAPPAPAPTAPAPTASAPRPPAPRAFTPPPAPAGHLPKAGPAAAAPPPTLPPRPTIKRPVLHTPPPAVPARGTAVPRTPAPVAVASAPPEPAPGGRNQTHQGYAKMPRGPRKGFAGFVTRPALWIVLTLVAALGTGLPLGVKKFGIPEIKFDFRPPHAREADVHKAAAGDADERDAEAVPKKPRSANPHVNTTPKEEPDASIIFDLPALEPEDGEPDPGSDAPVPKRSTAATSRDDPAGSRGEKAPMICGDVRNAQGMAIEGARVFLAVPPRMVRTDRRGHFCIICPPGTRTLRIEAVGRAKVTRTLQVGRERLETRFTLDAAN
jgi:hypothetical protein